MGARSVAFMVWLVAGCGCPEIDAGTEPADFPGVRGTLYLVLERCAEESCAEPVRKQGRVRAWRGGAIVADRSATADGRFEVPLDPGTYDIELIAPGARVDRSLAGVEVTADGGLGVVMVFQEEFEADALWVGFDGSVAGVRQDEILAAEGLEAESRQDGIVYAFMSSGGHPQLVGEGLLATYPGEVVSFDFGGFECPN